MRMESYEHGVPSWVDLGAPDPAAASEFYGALFGWECSEGPPEAGGYRMCMVADAPVAGIGPQQGPGAPYWTTYVNVTSADDTAAAVVANGGTVVVEPMDVLDVGRMAVFVDPVGAAFSVWEARAHKGAGIVNEPGTFSWAELITTDVEQSSTFYRAVFGWESETHGDGAHAYTEFQMGGRSIAGMMEKPPEMPAEAPPHWMVYFAVEDCDAAVEHVRGLGGTLLIGPVDVEPGRFAGVADDQGTVFFVIKLNPDATG